MVRGAIADLAGTVLAQLEVPLGSSAPNDILRVLRDLHRRLLADAHARPDRVQIAVVGTPGVVDAATGELRMVGDASELAGVDVVAALQLALGVRVMVENDVNLATLGEQAEGHGRDVNDFAVVSIGSGLGAGLVLGGELHRGATGAAGEIDLIPFGDADPSQIGIHADAIARYVAAVVAVLDVQLIVLAGSFGCRRELLEPVRAAVGQYLPSAVRLESSRLGDGAVLTGALALARRHGLELVTVRLTRANAAPIEERSA
jgi:predicted NBD/HSP70 family sugar kinase